MISFLNFELKMAPQPKKFTELSRKQQLWRIKNLNNEYRKKYLKLKTKNSLYYTDQKQNTIVEESPKKIEMCQRKPLNVHVNEHVRVQVENKETILRRELRELVITRNISTEITERLLKILTNYGCDLSKSKSTLLDEKNIKNEFAIKKIGENEEYMHIGIENNLKKLHYNFDNDREILIDVGIDGVPLFKSSSRTMWPILGAVSDQPDILPFVIGVLSTTGHPKDVNSFLSQFVDEFIYLNKNNVTVTPAQKEKKLKLRLFSVDTPAKSLLTGTKYHTSFYGCHMCQQIGEHKSKRTIYSSQKGTERNDENFAERHDLKHHNHRSILETAGVGMISMFPVDSMHIVDLGVTKKFLSYYLNKIKKLIGAMNEEYMKYKNYVPKEFVRLPRTFHEICRFKATEFRMLNMYTGIVLFRNIFTNSQYVHFLKLSCAIRFLHEHNIDDNKLDIAETLLNQYVFEFSAFYGEENVTYVVHTLLHLVECCRNFGSLASFSCYKFENFLQILKKKIKKPTYILKQLGKRINEMWSVASESSTKKPYVNDYDLKNDWKNGFCLLKSREILRIHDFVENENLLVGKKYSNLHDFFNEPIQSSSLDIYCANLNLIEKVLTSINLSEIKAKCIAIPFNDQIVFIPLVHTREDQ